MTPAAPVAPVAVHPDEAATVVLPPVVAGAYLPQLRQQVAAALRNGRDSGELVLDCRHVQELSPAAQAMLVGCSRAARLQGRRLRLGDPSPATARALRSTGLGHLLAPHA